MLSHQRLLSAFSRQSEHHLSFMWLLLPQALIGMLVLITLRPHRDTHRCLGAKW
jgi:hypothetical protein